MVPVIFHVGNVEILLWFSDMIGESGALRYGLESSWSPNFFVSYVFIPSPFLRPLFPLKSSVCSFMEDFITPLSFLDSSPWSRHSVAISMLQSSS